MNFLSEFLPITVIAAVILFIIKEAVEQHRRRLADKRRIDAFHVLLARECELNHWVHNRMKHTLMEIQRDFANPPLRNYVIERRASGAIIFRIRQEDGTEGAWPLPPVHTDLMNRVMLDVATLDKELFEHLEDAYDAVADIRHVRESLIEFIDSKDKVHLEGFIAYGLGELDEALIDLEGLYEACKGEPLAEIRLR